MFGEELEKKRKLLNDLIQKDANYEEILKVSVELDTLIEEYYGINIKKEKKN